MNLLDNKTRTCRYYLNGSSIKCEAKTTASTNGKFRKYVYLINYNKKENCFWVTSLANDYPLHTLQKLILNNEEKMINTITQNIGGDRFFRNVPSYIDKDKLI